ncbi:hypothetical protein [Amycolatopsis sp. lyj-90]|uniref:hypothetical protein n=1 Tax=Amycolatopsis sp. lyj-90 TaxID=2789285 RepID=UPI00397AC830
MARVVVVHGIGQEFLGPELMCHQVGPALRDGVRLAGGPDLTATDVACAFYGDLFFPPGVRSRHLPPWDEHDVDEWEADLLDAWWSAAIAVDPGVDDPAGSRGALGFVASRALLSRIVRAKLDALGGSRFFGSVSDRLMIFALKQVRRYLTDTALREAVRTRVTAAIGPDTRVLVAHSLGSVVAYETLCAERNSPVSDLVTLGSPLGLRSLVFDRLDPAPVGEKGVWPGDLRRWTNVADRGDIVALPNGLADRFPGVRDETITNGVRMHDLLRYLTAPTTGGAIARGIRNGEEA